MSVSVNTLRFCMPRWEPDGLIRLQAAALELFHEKGYDATTVAEISLVAGLTERTFFRHFTDKREVLFAGSQILEDVFVAAVHSAPTDASGLELVSVSLK